jgi:hypothetical protein
MKKIIFASAILLLTLSVFSQSAKGINFTITEKTGSVDISIDNGEWKNLDVDSTLSGGSITIVTGFHSHITLSINDKSFITINQLSHIRLENNSITDKGTIIQAALLNGYAVVNSKSDKKYKTIVQINAEKSTVSFDGSAGEVFYTPEKGSVVKSFLGNIKIGTKFSKVYFIGKHEICRILPGGRILESDYFLRREINAKPAEIIESNEIESYYESFFQNYTSNRRGNDYSNAMRP